MDLDAFFAAVEELERPELRLRPLVVGGDPDGRGVVATANYVARRFGIHSAMSSAEARRRCPDVIFVRPAQEPLLRVLAGRLERRTGRRADGRAHRSRRGLPRPHGGGSRVQRRAGGGGGRAGCRTRVDAAHRVPRRLDREGRRQGGERPAQARRADGRAARAGSLVPGAVRRAAAPRGRPARRAAASCRRRDHHRRPGSAGRRRPPPPLSREGRAAPARPGARNRPARRRARGRDGIDLERGDVPSGRVGSRPPARGAQSGWPATWASACRRPARVRAP